MNNTLLEIILQDTFVKTTALKKVAALNDFLLAKVYLSSSGENQEFALWISKIDPAIYAGINQQNIYSVFEELEKRIRTIEPLVIYLPSELPEEQIRQIGEKLRLTYGNNFLIDIQIDPSLIAGCALSYKGIYKDYSVKQKIMDNRKEVLAIFRKYIKH